MKKSISTDQTPANTAKVMDILTESPIRLEVLIKSVSIEKLRQPLGKSERARTIAMHELDHLGELESKLLKK